MIGSSQDALDLGTPVSAVGGRYTITGSEPLPANTTREYWVRVNVTRSEAAGVTISNYMCRNVGGTPTGGYGMYADLSVAANRDVDGAANNKACGSVPVHTLVIAKAGHQYTNLQWPEISNEYIDDQGNGLYPLSGSEFAIYDVDPRVSGSATPSRFAEFNQRRLLALLLEDHHAGNGQTSTGSSKRRHPPDTPCSPQPIPFTLTSQVPRRLRNERRAMGAEMSNPLRVGESRRPGPITPTTITTAPNVTGHDR